MISHPVKLLLNATVAISALAGPAMAQTLPITSYKDPVTGATVTIMQVPPPVPIGGPTGRPVSPPAAGPSRPSRTVWIPEHYTYDAVRRDYAWVQGRYVEPPPGHTRWSPGRWEFQKSGFVWIADHWE